MIKTIIFDFGDFFIDLNKEAASIELERLGISRLSDAITEQNYCLFIDDSEVKQPLFN